MPWNQNYAKSKDNQNKVESGHTEPLGVDKGVTLLTIILDEMGVPTPKFYGVMKILVYMRNLMDFFL